MNNPLRFEIGKQKIVEDNFELFQQCILDIFRKTTIYSTVLCIKPLFETFMAESDRVFCNFCLKKKYEFLPNKLVLTKNCTVSTFSFKILHIFFNSSELQIMLWLWDISSSISTIPSVAKFPTCPGAWIDCGNRFAHCGIDRISMEVTIQFF